MMSRKLHTIHFFDVFNNFNTDTNINLFRSLFDRGVGVYPFQKDENSYTLEILEFEDNFIFGKLSREEDYKEGLTTIKKKDDNTPINPEDYILQKFTFFYINIADNHNISKLSAINNIGLKIPECFASFFTTKHQMVPFSIFPELTPDVYKKVDNSNIKSMECTFSDISTHNNRTTFNSLFNWDCYLKNATLQVTFKSKPKNMADALKKGLNNFTKLKLKTDEFGTLDFIKQIYTKKSYIDVSKISLSDFTEIKRALKNFSTL